MYTLKIFPKARKNLKEISHRYQETLLTAFEDLRDDPFLGKPLERELTGRYTYRVGVYRIIYKIRKKDKVVEILDAGHRATVYQ